MTNISRRLFLAQAAAWASPVFGAPGFQKYPFTLGVMSGDPSPDGLVSWTRLAPDPLHGGGMGKDSVSVQWMVAEDEGMRKIVKHGKETAAANLAHSVHVEVTGLKPERPYWYQFKAGKELSPIGRAITAPKDGTQQSQLKFAFTSCQNWQDGLWTAYDHMLADNPDLVVELGDYIYEGGIKQNAVRPHNGPEIKTLSDYRNRHALYKSDPAIQKMHLHCPWILTWDDHEVQDNYANDIPKDNQPHDAFMERRANAYQAYYEHMPMRISSLPHGSKMQMYRRVSFGGLVQFAVLDTRQYRTDQPCGDGNRVNCEGRLDAKQTIMGDVQESWLKDTLDKSPARWNIVANQVLMAAVDNKPGPDEQYNMDQWSGYEACRDRLMHFLADRKPTNPILITGDIHSNWVSDLVVKWKDEKSPVVGTEFIGTSISSAGDGTDERPDTQAWYRENPHLKMFNGQRGYVMVTLDKDRCRADYRVIPYVTRPGAPIRTRASWMVENGRLGVQKA